MAADSTKNQLVSALVLDMQNELISTLIIVPDVDIIYGIYGIAINLYNKSIETVAEEFVSSITCSNKGSFACFVVGHFHENRKNEPMPSIISQRIYDNILELTFYYNGKNRKLIYQHDCMFTNWHSNIKDFQHVIIPFCQVVFNNTNNAVSSYVGPHEDFNYIKEMIKSRSCGQPYFYIDSCMTTEPVFINLPEYYKLFPEAEAEAEAEDAENNDFVEDENGPIYKIEHAYSKVQINMDDDVWFKC